jgi:hypothetical protein
VLTRSLTMHAALIGALALGAACDDGNRSEPEQCETYCAPGSGFPCPCNAADGCNDGSECAGVDTDDALGFCARACVANADCAVDLPCTAKPQCVLTLGAGSACAYVCEGDWDCPKNMACFEAGNGKLCYPADQPDAG